MSLKATSKDVEQVIGRVSQSTNSLKASEKSLKLETQIRAYSPVQSIIGQESLHSTEVSSPSTEKSQEKSEEGVSAQREDPSIALSAFSKPSKRTEISDSLGLAANTRTLAKALFTASLHLPTSTAFKIVKATKDRLTFFNNKIYQRNQRGSPENGETQEELRQSGPTQTESVQVRKANSSAYPVVKLATTRLQTKRSAPECEKQVSKDSDTKEEETFQCKYCGGVFGTGQALGGHMSRKHSGKSMKYNHKKDVRKQREGERMRLYMAKKKYFEEMGYNYDDMIKTAEGKSEIKSLINRSRIKKIKSSLAGEEQIISNENISN